MNVRKYVVPILWLEYKIIHMKGVQISQMGNVTHVDIFEWNGKININSFPNIYFIINKKRNILM